MNQTLNILDNYTDWLRKYQLLDTDANFIIFLTNLTEAPEIDNFYHNEEQLEFRVAKDKENFSFITEFWVETDEKGWYILEYQRKEFSTLNELILAIKQNNVVVWNKSED